MVLNYKKVDMAIIIKQVLYIIYSLYRARDAYPRINIGVPTEPHKPATMSTKHDSPNHQEEDIPRSENLQKVNISLKHGNQIR